MQPREIELVRIANIQVGERFRKPLPEAIDRLARSIREIGLQTPIHVRYVEEMEIDGKPACNMPVLVAGATRLAAAKQLGWEKIEAIALGNDDIEAQLWEIDENLARAELTPAQIAEHTARRKALWSTREIQVGQLAPPEIGFKNPPPQETGFAAETAKATGRDKRTINRAVRRGEKIAPDVLHAVQGTTLDTGTNLDRLARMPVPQQREAIAHPTKLAPPAANEFEARERWLASGMTWWNRACQEWREEFLARADRPTFDRTRAGAA